MKNKEKYDKWVEDVCAFLKKTGPKLGNGGRCCSVFQSRIEINPQVAFIGYNAHEDYGYIEIDKKRFYEGNPSFYADNGKERMKWRIWSRLYGAFDFVKYTKPMEDGNFVFFNAVYFGTSNIEGMKALPNGAESISTCLNYTGELIHEIIEPKCIVCFSIPECFDKLNDKYNFQDVKNIKPSDVINKDLQEEMWRKWGNPPISKQTIKKGIWENIPVYGIPHPSASVKNDDWGLIALYLRGEMEKLGI